MEDQPKEEQTICIDILNELRGLRVGMSDLSKDLRGLTDDVRALRTEVVQIQKGQR